MEIRLKRAYEDPDRDDGHRFLVDRLWPRGVAKDTLRLTAWLKDVAPSAALRRWFSHDPTRWEEFRRRYAAELRQRPEALEPLYDNLAGGRITLVYGARDTGHNHALVLRDFLRKHPRPPKERKGRPDGS